MEKANPTAEQVLNEFNSSELSQRLGGPFVLSDYSTTVSESRIEGKDAVRVLYRLNRPVGFKGHPQHFEVCVFKDTGEIRIFKGR